MPCTEKRARLLLERKRAVVHKMQPFTIRLKDRTVEESKLQSLELKLDPGSKTSGVAILEVGKDNATKAIFLGEIRHKTTIKTKLDSRRNLRRSRRNRKTRYRKPRFDNRKREKDWLPPSLRARVDQTINLTNKLIKLSPITLISTEHAKFDTQLMQNPYISGIEYQQGELHGYEVKEYLLEKWRRKCAYCEAENVPLEVEHIIPKSRGGTNRISNLTIACVKCNQIKNNYTAEEFGYPDVQKRAKLPLRDAAMMNATRWRLLNELKQFNLPVKCGTGARTKMQRIQHNLTKTHYYDACCVADTPNQLTIKTKYINMFSAIGRGTRQMCTTDKYGFPKSHRTSQKVFYGFKTGDIVKASIPKGKYQGQHMGRVAVRASGYFDIKDNAGKRACQGINHKHFSLVQHNSGWQYDINSAIPPTVKTVGFLADGS